MKSFLLFINGEGRDNDLLWLKKKNERKMNYEITTICKSHIAEIISSGFMHGLGLGWSCVK